MEFARHLRPHKILLLKNDVNVGFPERYKDFNTRIYQGDADIEWLLEDIDVFLTIETPYRWDIVKRCREKKIKTVLYTMCEMTPEKMPYGFDLYMCPSPLDMQLMPEPRVAVDVPLAMDRLNWKRRTFATHFVHSASHGGVAGRKGTKVLIDALPFVKDPYIKFTIYTWKPIPHPGDPRLEIKHVNFKNYWQIWREGDVLVYPQGANGICLPIIEAWASGLGVITTDIYPFNEYMPQEMLFEHGGLQKRRLGGGLVEVDDPILDPRLLAAKIDEWAGKDISHISDAGKEFGEQRAWKKQLKFYKQILNEV